MRTLNQELACRIRSREKITFAEFMDLALYWPRGGYYRGPSPTGAAGDFYTAPGAHPAFGSLLCLQLYQMWKLLDRRSPFWVVEAGAGNGLLGRDVVNFSRRIAPDFRDALRYICLDTSPSAQDPNLQPLAADGLPLSGVVGCILSNELLDAFPVHVVEKHYGQFLEVYVTQRNDEIVEVLDDPSTPALRERLEALGIELAEGQRAEINLAMASWLKDAAHALDRGYLVTIDYGRKADDLYSQERFRGTLTTFFRHIQTDNPYGRIGRQDMTSQVDFTTLMLHGTKLGLTNLAYLTQAQFLTNLGLRRWIAGLPSMGLPQQQRDSNRMGMLQLIRPGGMGDFKVLVQGKDVSDAPLWGVEPSEQLMGLTRQLSPPLLTDRNIPLLQGRYPFYGADTIEFGSR